jgi:ribose-phosphate pyrophosphokinase
LQKVVANMLTVAGVDHIITMDLHASQMQGFFSRPIDNLVAEPSIAKYIVEKIPNYQNGVVVSKSAGGAKRVTSLADRLKIDFALIHRERKKQTDGQPSRSALVGEVKGKVALLVDDIIDTVRNFIEAAEILQFCGAEKVHVVATHGILSGSALAEIEECDAIDEIIVTNTYPLPDWKRAQTTKLRVIDVSGVMAEAIRRTHNGESISYLFHTAV